ncbi:alpha/beta fold hydrolase [Silicimonas algicola]|uniref:Pimeloyl-ACP methyl ester carboxylesterase n=1 Tax=Silicimonas algicola TaxID=1826607 RepID=A0A316GG69_9RHOB|nr:alpha/beta hydrolase [Silicimonas algicola]PWK58956.1 pimeloyl-ACP methyl ester carboxylesterase [Silicimonas algicola]
MIARRELLTGLCGVALATGAWGAGAYRATMAGAEARIARSSTVIRTSAGQLEFAVAGHGPPVMMIHGTGGGFDQGLLFGHGLLEAGFQIVTPSRFGYLRSSFPEDASPARQADVLMQMLDHLGLDQIAVAGGSAGALTAAEFALRHPERCTHLVLIVPAANLTGRDPVAFTALQRAAVERILNSDAWFWAFATLAPDMLLRTLLATDPALLDRASPEERRRADLIREGLMPISRKTDGLRNDGFWAGAPTLSAFESIAVPTLILSCEDDLFGTADTARLLAGRIRGARLVVYPDGGHIWLGHDADLMRDISAFIREPRA